MIRAALALAVLAAWMLAIRVPTRRQRELASGLVALLAIDMARLVALPPPVDHALSVGWYAVTAAVVWRALRQVRGVRGDEGRRREEPRGRGVSVSGHRVNEGANRSGVDGQENEFASLRHVPSIAAAACVVALAIIPNTIVATFWLALAVQCVAALHAIARREIPDQVATVALILAASSLADVAGPWLAGAHVRDWYTNRIPAIATWLAIAGWEGRCWISARRRRESS